jgi:plastocyanin
VVNKTISGDTLLATIVGLAALQVFVQVFFFLHLGRGPKPLYNVGFFVATLGAIMLVVGGSLYIMSHLHYNMATPTETAKQLAEDEGIAQVEGQKTGACPELKVNHKVVIVHGSLSPNYTQAHLCDTISFINQDSITHQISFGTAAKPGTYAGQTEQTMRKGLSQTVNLNQTGTYLFYDPLHPELSGSFTATAQ